MPTSLYTCPAGAFLLTSDGSALVGLSFDAKAQATAARPNGADAVLKEAAAQLDAYFSGSLRHFSVPLAPKGSTFQKAVWQALLAIPYGETRSYKDIAQTVGSPKGFRAVGMANNKNPLAIFIPCHRVVGANGALTGYAGGLDMKKYLLDLEENNK